MFPNLDENFLRSRKILFSFSVCIKKSIRRFYTPSRLFSHSQKWFIDLRCNWFLVSYCRFSLSSLKVWHDKKHREMLKTSGFKEKWLFFISTSVNHILLKTIFKSIKPEETGVKKCSWYLNRFLTWSSVTSIYIVSLEINLN